VHVAAGNGNLIPVAVAARLLPRHWDGSRLLRFLAGLAMLALAFTTPSVASPIEATVPPAVAAPAVAVEAGGTAAAPDTDVTPSTAVERLRPAMPVTAPLVVAAAVLILTGLAARAQAERAPPAFG
jgi:hypothetical protein